MDEYGAITVQGKWLKYRVDSSGCWNFYDRHDKDGYGRVSIKGRDYSAHRLVFGDMSIPVVRHICDNPPCIRPDHLLPGTALENNRDTHARGRNADRKGIKHPLARLSETEVREIKDSPLSQTALGALYGVDRRQIGKIKRGERWNHL